MSIDSQTATNPPASAYTQQSSLIKNSGSRHYCIEGHNARSRRKGDQHNCILRPRETTVTEDLGNSCSAEITMGNFGSRKKKQETKEPTEEEVWKKQDGIKEPIVNDKQRKKKKKKKKKGKKNVTNSENGQDLETPSTLTHNLLREKKGPGKTSPAFSSSPHRSRKFVKDMFSQRGIKMADESSSSSQGYSTPMATPPARRAHPVFKVTTPPPPRRTLEVSNKISSPTLQRVKHQGQHENVTCPSPPMRRTNAGADDKCAPELPPRRNRQGNSSSPVILRKNADKFPTQTSSPSVGRKINESCLKIGSPRVIRQGSERTRCNKIDEERPPTPPPRKSSTSSKPSSPKIGNPNVRRAYPVFKVDTPPPARRDYKTNDIPAKKQTVTPKGKDYPTTEEKDNSSKPPQDLVYARINRENERDPPMSLPSDKITKQQDAFQSVGVSLDKDVSSVSSSQVGNVERRQNVTPRVVISPYENSMFLEQGKPKTLSVEIDEENYKNIMKENLQKYENSDKKENFRKNEMKYEATMSVLPGPVIAIKSIIPPPERAVLSNVPPPSPSSTDIIEERDEDLEDPYEHEIDLKNKEIEEFGEIVSQRLSMLLESKDVVHEQSEFSDSEGSCPENKEEVQTYDRNETFRNYQDLADYDWVEPGNNILCSSEVSKPVAHSSQRPVKTPEGRHDATTMDMANNNFSHDKRKQATGTRLEEHIVSGNSCKQNTTGLVKDNGTREAVHGEDRTVFPKNVAMFDYKNYARGLKQRKKESHMPSSSALNEEVGPKYPVFEEKIIPTSIKRKSLLEELESKRESDVISEVISSYATPEEESKTFLTENTPGVESSTHESVVSKQKVNLQQAVNTTVEAKVPSRLDQSLQKIFKMPVVDETYSKLLPVESFLEDVLESDVMPVPASYPVFDIEDTMRMRRQVTGRQSVTRTESDLDISEHMDEDSSDSMLADDEDELGSGEILFSRTYPDSRHSGEYLLGHGSKNRTFHDDYSDDNFWDDDEDVEDDQIEESTSRYEESHTRRCPDPIDFSSSYLCASPLDAGDVAFDSARRQMHEIHSHLQNLRQQMENLADKAEGSNLRPSLCIERRSRAVSD